MHQWKSLLLTAFLLSSVFAGCLQEQSEQESIELVVSYQATNGTVVEMYEGGELVEVKGAELVFDFSGTTSNGELVRYGVNLLDGSPATTVEADEGSIVTVEFLDHGLNQIALFATDDKAQQAIVSIVVRIELRMEWVEYATYDPMPMPLDSIPKNEGIPPAAILIESRVENPDLIENIGGGREVEVTWGLIDETNLACQQHQGEVNEGETVVWNTVHFATYEVHELQVQYDSGQDYINVNQIILLEYEHLESPSTV